MVKILNPSNIQVMEKYSVKKKENKGNTQNALNSFQQSQINCLIKSRAEREYKI